MNALIQNETLLHCPLLGYCYRAILNVFSQAGKLISYSTFYRKEEKKMIKTETNNEQSTLYRIRVIFFSVFLLNCAQIWFLRVFVFVSKKLR